jgi:hypothetical protein
MLLIILLWALKSPLHDTAISICTKIFKTLINLELASYAITMLPYVRDLIREEPVLQGIFLNIGLLFNENALRMNVIVAALFIFNIENRAHLPPLLYHLLGLVLHCLKAQLPRPPSVPQGPV